MLKLLLVEDDLILSDSIKEIISSLGEVTQVYDGDEAVFEGERGIFDLIILDLMLPGQNGFEVLKKWRAKSIMTPVLILTAKDAIEDKVNGFRQGADDYLTKPFHREELLLRVQALLRRSANIQEGQVLTLNELTIHLTDRSVHYQGQEIRVQGKEFDLLHYLMQNSGQILTKDQIFDRIWGFQSDTTLSVVEVYMSNLRKHLKPFGIEWIKTLRNVGYLFSPEELHG